jgi:DNA-binding response OmpR family regulator
MRLLIVEDNETLTNGLKTTLTAAGFAVDIAHDGALGLKILRIQQYDLLILDLGLPTVDGIVLLRHLRYINKKLPVLIISSRDELDQRIEGLDLGADDYLCKPFILKEVTARVRALLRRSNQSVDTIIQQGRLSLNTHTRSLSLDNISLELHRRELSVLEYLMTHTDRVVSKEQIADHISSFDDDINPVAIETYVSRLRKKLDGALKLKTVRGLGYLLENE